MRRHLFAASVVLALLALPGATTTAGEHPKGDLEWVNDLAKARKLAKESGKPLIAYFTFDT